MLWASLVEIGPVVLEKNCLCIFAILLLSYLEKKVWPFIWINMDLFYPSMLCAKFGRNSLAQWFWRRRWKCEKFTDNRQTCDRKSSGELERIDGTVEPAYLRFSCCQSTFLHWVNVFWYPHTVIDSKYMYLLNKIEYEGLSKSLLTEGNIKQQYFGWCKRNIFFNQSEQALRHQCDR